MPLPLYEGRVLSDLRTVPRGSGGDNRGGADCGGGRWTATETADALRAMTTPTTQHPPRVTLCTIVDRCPLRRPHCAIKTCR